MHRDGDGSYHFCAWWFVTRTYLSNGDAPERARMLRYGIPRHAITLEEAIKWAAIFEADPYWREFS